jgi:hypothetical protein
VKWVTYQLGFILLLLLGVIGVCLSLMWVVHIILYMLPVYPISNLLNEVFIKLDGVFPLFGVVAFALFCAYLMGGWRPLCRVGWGGGWGPGLAALPCSRQAAPQPGCTAAPLPLPEQAHARL